jgi:CRISPR-associated protein Csd1
MILKALCDYYDRKRDDLPAKGVEAKQIGFLAVLDENGNFLRFEDRRIDKNSAQTFYVAQAVARSINKAANYLWDNAAYVFGYVKEGKNESKIKECNALFVDRIEKAYALAPDNSALKALHLFYSKGHEECMKAITNDPLWPEIEKNLNKKYANFSFLIEGDSQIVAEQEDLLHFASEEVKHGNEAICLVTGEHSEPVRTTTPTMIAGSRSNAKLVSFQTDQGYDSYGKTQAYNAPISAEAEFKFSTALKHMLSADSKNKFLVGNRTYLFWASSQSEASKITESGVFALFGISNNAGNPDEGVLSVRKVFESVYSGKIPYRSDDRFFILGLAPNAARIAVSYWYDLPIRDFAAKILLHFEDMEIIDTRKDKKPYRGLRSILSAVTLGGKTSDVIPSLPDPVLKSIFQGIPYPYTLLDACIARIRAEQQVGITRAAILKAYLNRLRNNTKKINVMLDKENVNQGYLCGRLFAVLDKIQQDAKNVRTIKDRYMNAASATPASVFSTILNLSSHHSEYLSEGQKVFYEKLKQEIIDKISPNGFPAHLDLQDQGRFFVGYYHQMQDFYTSHKDNE